MAPARRPRSPARARARARTRRRLLGAGVALAIVVVAAIALVSSHGGGGSAAHRGLIESVFQDDDYLIYRPTTVVGQTLDQLRAAGVDRLRLTVLWSQIAPAAGSRVKPAGFDARNPAAYPAIAWYPYDRVLVLARQRGIGVDFNVTAPGPLWAMAPGAPTPKIATHFRPDAAAFGDFVTALGRRYDGHYTVRAAGTAITLPRVSFWSIWNEPNQPGWLYPQWSPGSGAPVPAAPGLYRSYLAAAFAALHATGHTPAADTILVGELAPEGRESTGPGDAIAPLRFLRSLYCLDDAYRPLRGAAAARQPGCPTGGDGASFVAANPALFDATGFAHHPYSFFRPPEASLADPNFVPLSDLGRLESALDSSLAAYGVHRALPLYLTEYGYETNPPDPFRGVPLALQARYLDQGQRLAAADPRVRAMSQFLLYDAAPNPAFPSASQGYWSTFQTGLRFAAGGAKPSLAAYELPIDVAQPRVAAGTPVRVWGMLRPAPNFTAQTASIQWRGRHSGYRSVATVHTADPSGILDASVALPAGPGAVRIQWRRPGGAPVLSRAVGVSVG